MTANTRTEGTFRVEEDALGKVEVPADHLWGAQTQRSHLNFPIGVERYRWGRPVIRALGILKKCAALANRQLGQLPPEQVDLIVRAAQDATPLTLGQVISGWVAQLDQALEGLGRSLPGVYALAIGGTAVGTGLNADPRFGEVAARKIAEDTGKPFVSAANKFAALSAHDAMVNISAPLRTLAGAPMKIPHHLRR